MECVCAIAVVGLLSAVILPLTSSAMKSLQASSALRTVASNAASQNATTATDKTKKDPSRYDNGVQTMYVTISYTTSKLTDMRAESSFLFTYNKSSDSNQKVQVTYYDLKYGKEEEDAK